MYMAILKSFPTNFQCKVHCSVGDNNDPLFAVRASCSAWVRMIVKSVAADQRLVRS